jgi:hypothetical protein
MIHNVSGSGSVMEIQASFDVLSAVVDGYESRGLAVETVDATTDGGSVHATVEVAVPLGAGDETAAGSAVVTGAGDVRVEVPASDLCRPASRPDVVSATVEAARVTDGAVVATVDVVVDPTASASESPVEPVADGSGETDECSTGTAGRLAAVRDESVPPFEDVPYLRRLYERCDTFAAMTRLFETDVSAETVRRYMIEAGVHDPDSYATDEADATAEDLPVDGADVPDDLTVGAVADAVVDARTTYEVSRRVGLDLDQTRDLLRRLDLLDLVTARIDAAPDHRASTEEVAARIRRRAPGDASPADS